MKKVFFVSVLLIAFAGGIYIGQNINLFSDSKEFYIQLEEDYCINEVGILKKGTMIKYDQGYSEGFSRYILYVNIPSNISGKKYEPERQNEIIPYWVSPIDSSCIKLNQN